MGILKSESAIEKKSFMATLGREEEREGER